MDYHLVCGKSNTAGATYGTGTAYPYEALEFTPYFFGGGRVCVARSLVFCVMFCRSLFIPLSFSFGHYMFFFDLRLLINLLVSPNFSS